MLVKIPLELEPFVEQEFASGRYSSREEVLIQALELMREEREHALIGIREGLEDIEHGLHRPISEASSDIRQRFEIPESE